MRPYRGENTFSWLSRDQHSRYARQVVHNFDTGPVGAQLTHRKGVAEFHHKPAAGPQQTRCFRDEASINCESVFATEERERRLVIADFGWQGLAVARCDIRW